MKNMSLFLITLPLCLICVLLTHSRGPIVFLLISMMAFVNIRSRAFYKMMMIGGLILIAGWSFFSQYTDIFSSIFSSKAQDSVGGSNADMRFDQLGAALILMSQSWLWGLGYKFKTELDNDLIDRLLGSESMWFTIMPGFGLIGVMANLILAYYCLVKLPRMYHSRMLFFLTLAYWVVGSLTSLPGMMMHYYYFFIILLIKRQTQQSIYVIRKIKETV